MAYNAIGGFPRQQLSFSQKTKAWRSKCVDFGDDHSLIHYQPTRMTVYNMQINYDLLNGKVHARDMKAMLNPYGLDASFIPDEVQHYPIINSKLRVLQGEEDRRVFDYRAVVTNPTAISEIEEEKNRQVNAALQQLVAESSQSEEQFTQELERLSDYFQYDYQDKREQQGNYLLEHYVKELDIKTKFNSGFRDAYTVAEELYQVDIVGGEPTVDKLDPREIRVIRSGTSNNIEDADMVVIEQYWSPGKIIDTYWDQLSKKDIAAIENCAFGGESGNNPYTDSMDNLDPRYGLVPAFDGEWTAGDTLIDTYDLFDESKDYSFLPYDLNGNVRVLRVYWKSRRKIKKVKSYDPETGEEKFDFYPETYIIDPDKGEEEQIFWVNEAWEGTKIGSDIYVNMRPRPVQYNRLSNPSRCHFGIIGSIYTDNGDRPYSMVDIMKPYAYQYDIYHDRLNKLIAKNVGKVIRLDFAKVPKGWDTDRWLYYLNVNGIAVENSFKEGDIGRATGVLSGQMNNASSGVIDASLGSEIQQYISLLEWIATKIGELAGITRQREGQVSNRETVGGVERATLQSAHSTEWLFITHESVKKRVLECLMETAKVCLKGRKKKFEYILPDGSKAMMEVDGDVFAECDWGIVVDNSNGTQELNQKLDMLSQAALQNDKLDFSTIVDLYSTKSLADKRRGIKASEQKRMLQAQRQQEQEMQIAQQQQQYNLQMAQLKMQQDLQMNRENNETKILVAQINSQAEAQRFAMMNHDNEEANEFTQRQLDENARQFNEKLALDKKKHEDDMRLKEKQLNKQPAKKS